MPRCALCFFTANLILLGYVEPQLLFIFRPLGLTPIDFTFAPSELSNSGPALYPAPLAQSITIFNPFKSNFLEKFFFKILIYSFVPLSNLFTLPSFSGLERFFAIFLSIKLPLKPI